MAVTSLQHHHNENTKAYIQFKPSKNFDAGGLQKCVEKSFVGGAKSGFF